jgi:hypothetical protein
MSVSQSIPVTTIPKNKNEELRVSLDLFNGYWLFNTRIFFQASDGSMRPGKGGFAIKVDKLEAYAEAVTDALMQVETKGLSK